MSGNRGSLIPGFEATFPLDLSMVDQHGALQIRLKLLHSERSEGRTAQKAKTAGIHRSDFEHDWKLLNHIFFIGCQGLQGHQAYILSKELEHSPDQASLSFRMVTTAAC